MVITALVQAEDETQIFRRIKRGGKNVDRST